MIFTEVLQHVPNVGGEGCPPCPQFQRLMHRFRWFWSDVHEGSGALSLRVPVSHLGDAGGRDRDVVKRLTDTSHAAKKSYLQA